MWWFYCVENVKLRAVLSSPKMELTGAVLKKSTRLNKNKLAIALYKQQILQKHVSRTSLSFSTYSILLGIKNNCPIISQFIMIYTNYSLSTDAFVMSEAPSLKCNINPNHIQI